MGVTMIACYFGFTIFRMRAYQAALSTLPYVLFNQWLLIDQMNAGRLVASDRNPVFGHGRSGIPDRIAGVRAARAALASSVSPGSYHRDAARCTRSRARHAARLREEARIREVHALEEEVRRHVAEKSRDLAESLLLLKETPHAPSI